MNGASPAARLPVQQPREQLLAGPALPEDQHRRRELRHPLDQIDDVADLLAGPDQELALALLGDLGAERDHLPVQILPLAGVADERSELVVVEVLGDVVVGAVLHRLHGGLDLVDRRDHDALDEAVVLLDDPQHVEAADARQPHVQQEQVDVLVLQQAQRRLAARHAQDLVVPLQDRGQRIAHALIVVADQDGLGGPVHRRRHCTRARLQPRCGGQRCGGAGAKGAECRHGAGASDGPSTPPCTGPPHRCTPCKYTCTSAPLASRPCGNVLVVLSGSFSSGSAVRLGGLGARRPARAQARRAEPVLLGIAVRLHASQITGGATGSGRTRQKTRRRLPAAPARRWRSCRCRPSEKE